MISELGHFALILSLCVALVQMLVPMWAAQRGWRAGMDLGSSAALVQFTLVLLAFAALTWAFVTSDFSVWLVAAHSNSAVPLLYKVTGVWGNHEGSMLLWVLILTLFGAMVAGFGGNLPLPLKARVLSVQAAIGTAFLAFILFTSNPFLRLENPPFDGQDLNPLLQDPGLAFHPPFLYLGYVGLSMAFSFAIAALIEGKVDAAWARWVRPWTLAAWMFLTIGIALGSWWAYYELGWGGWWFWDPVENASFMPWLIATALLHSAIVVEKRDTLKRWTILLAILAFSFSLIGTFIVRSGVITSVHAFANDPERGKFILAILAVAIGGGLGLFALRAPALKSGAMFAPVSRESGMIVNNLLLVVAAFVVFIGTIWPLVMEFATGDKISVGKPFFETAFTPFMILLAVFLPFGAILPWKRGVAGRSLRALLGPAVLALALASLIWTLQTGGRMLGPVGLALAVWVIGGSIVDFALRIKLGQAPVGESLRRLGNLPRADWGKLLGHAGLGVSIFGIAAITAWQAEDIRTLRVGESYSLGWYDLRFDGVQSLQGPNYLAEIGTFSLSRQGIVIAAMFPEKRSFDVQAMTTTEAAINTTPMRDVYVTLGDQQGDGSWAVRSYLKPFAMWLWGGALIMGLGGLISLSDRRFRLGVARRPAARVVAAQ